MVSFELRLSEHLGRAMYHTETIKIFNKLLEEKNSFVGGTKFTIGGLSIEVESKDGIGGLIEEWFGAWCISKGFKITNPKLLGSSQEFPDYYVGEDKAMLEIKAFNRDAGPNFDIANFESYCSSLAAKPQRIQSDYLIFGYRLNGASLRITDIWLKKIWEITTSSDRYALKTQIKRDVIYNIRPAVWYSDRSRKTFSNADEFVDAVYETQKEYRRLDRSPDEDAFRQHKLKK